MKKPLLALSLLYPLISHAFFCPTNFNQIQLGDSTAQVAAQCGKPTTEKESTEDNPNVPQQWSYFAPQQSLTAQLSGNQGTSQVIMTFDASGALLNMMINNVSVSTTMLCGIPIQLGDSREKVKSACGTPSFVNKQNQSGGDQSSSQVKITEYFYNSSPPVTLVFENDQLKEKR